MQDITEIVEGLGRKFDSHRPQYNSPDLYE